MSAPSVYAYLDYRTFLNDWIHHRRADDPDYSYARFAREGGGSKAALANVLSGARSPRPATLDAFARAMDLSPPERNYLGLLVDLSAAVDVTTRREVMDRILSTERYRQLGLAESSSDDDVFRFAEHWYLPVIREMATLPGFREDPEWIATTLRPTIQTHEASQALQTLLDLGFLCRDPEGRLQAREIRFRTQPEAVQRAATHYHRSVVPELLRSLDVAHSEYQHVVAATVTLAPEQLAEAKARIQVVVEQLATIADDRGARGEARVYQFSVQLLPVTAVVGE
jgi:uncharacterized protein (TIGR02147 family)